MTISSADAYVCKNIEICDREKKTVEVERQVIYLPGTDCVIRPGVSLAGFTSYRVGGPAEWYVAPRNITALEASIKYAKSQGIQITVLGAGSNLLVSDCGISGLVIGTRHLRYSNLDPETGLVTVAAGESIPNLAWEAAKLGFEGLEWSVGIPGTVGGAVVMNAGAHNGCIADILVSAEVLLSDGTLKTFTASDLGYAYRTSNLQGSKHIVTQATFQLKPGADPAVVLATTKQHKEHRLTTQPYDKPSCGSVFRNPKPYSAGWLIEQAGLKGYQIGKAQVAPRHANFIVNCGGASACDIFNLIRYIQNSVQEHWSIALEPEVKMLGHFQIA
ncbi:MAG: UDP-N-acetylmuramate dehydrogenase [Calothrix sp. C42_A2020_038]|nr:UDP-N-acetylmuramate dehydrogenase [Calothrix sp. C42_A2020_038]